MKDGGPKRTWKKVVVEESMWVVMCRDDEFCRSKWVVGCLPLG